MRYNMLMQTQVSIFDTMKAKQPWFTLLVIGSVIGLTLLMLNSDFGVQLVALIVGGWISLYYRVIRGIQADVLRTFASKHGLAYEPTGAIDSDYGTIFHVGHSQDIGDSIRGTYRGASLQAFRLNYTVGHGRNAHTSYYLVASLTVQGQFPPMLISPNANLVFGSEGSITAAFDGSEPVHLEGDFHKQFNVSTRHGMQIPARQVLTPDVMELIQANFTTCYLEFSGDMLHVYRPGYISSPTQIEHVFDHLVTLGTKLSSEARSFHHDTEVTIQNLQPPRTGSGTWTKVFIALIIAIFIFQLLVVIAAFMWSTP